MANPFVVAVMAAMRGKLPLPEEKKNQKKKEAAKPESKKAARADEPR